jgi:hypothetical protein
MLMKQDKRWAEKELVGFLALTVITINTTVFWNEMWFGKRELLFCGKVQSAFLG